MCSPSPGAERGREGVQLRKEGGSSGGRVGCLPDAPGFHPGLYLRETRGCDSARASLARSPR